MSATMRRRQFRAVLRLELRKLLLGRRAVPMVLFAGMPVLFTLLFVAVVRLVAREDALVGTAEASTFFAGIYQFILRGLVYLGTVWIFMSLFRGEVLERSLHYYFLAPLRRELLVAGKFTAGWLASTLLFAGSTLLTLALIFGSLGWSRAAEYLLSGAGLRQALAYAGVTGLACLGYGAVFLLIGLFFRNPIVPAAAIFFWEGANPYLPSLLKKISVIFYLHSLLPIAPPPGPFAVLTDPVPVWLAAPGLALFTAATLVLAAWRIRRMEIAYGVD